MLEGQVVCTEGAMIHKAAMRRDGHRRGTKGAHQQCYDRTSQTILFFPFHLFLSPYLSLYNGHPPFAPCYGLELDLFSDTKTGTRCLADCAPPPLSITCPTLALTVPSTRASVPADVHLLCPSHARLSSLLPYVSLHRSCMLPDPLTCVTPHPLYTF